MAKVLDISDKLGFRGRRSDVARAHQPARVQEVSRCTMLMLRLEDQHFANVVHHIDHPGSWERCFEELHHELGGVK